MKKIIPFKKDINFKTNISEVTSISLEHHLSFNNNDIIGEFIISGDYKVSDKSLTVEPFEFNIPFEIMLDDIYDTSSACVDIDDFYYEIIDNSILSISIDVCVDKLKEVLIKEELVNIEEKKDIIEELYEEQNNNLEDKLSNIEDDRCIEEDDILPGEKEIDTMEDKINEEVKINKDDNVKKEDINDKINSIFSNVGDNSMYVTYNIYIIREGDTIESILEKYGVTEEILKKYNNLSDLKLGDKIIIPAN